MGFFEEMKQYVRFGADDEEALRALGPYAAPRFPLIAEEFYQRLSEFEGARAVLAGPEQIARLKKTLHEWLELLFTGPWDSAYFERRWRIGAVHVRIGLPQRFMFGAMNLIRTALLQVANTAYDQQLDLRIRAVTALHKILDLELAIMLDAYREAFVDQVQLLERQEKLRLEKQLAISEARYEEIVERGVALVCTLDPQGTILLFNRRCEDLTGIERAGALDRSWLEIFVPADGHSAVHKLFAEVLAGRRVAPYESMISGPRECRVRWHFTTLPSATGAVLCAIGLDVTEEHELAVRTRQAERLAALGTMAAGLAHEIRNPLNAAHLQLALMQRRLARKEGADVEGAAEAAQVVGGEMKRLAMLVEEFLLFARPQPLRKGSVDLRGIVDGVISLIAPEAASVGVDLALAPGAAVAAQLDDERMKQVVLNLVRNAVEASGRGGRVLVSVGSQDGTAQLSVEDNGPGLPSGDAPIFEPFFTTKPGGTGLGLSIVHRIVTAHGGRVTVDSRPGRTVFFVALPLAAR